MKAIVLILLAAIIISLGAGLFFLTKDDGDSKRLLTALKLRIVLSVGLVLVLVAAYFVGGISN